QAGLSPGTVNFLEGHGTSTRVGDVVELQSLHAVFGEAGLPHASVPLGSVKSNIGHLKAAAGAAGLLKTVLALHHKVLPPSLHFDRPNPDIDFADSPFRVNTEARDWDGPPGGIRRAGVSAFGFGGANFHAVVDEYIPGWVEDHRPKSMAVPSLAEVEDERGSPRPFAPRDRSPKLPVRGALVIGADDRPTLLHDLRTALAEAQAGRAPAVSVPATSTLRAPHRLAIDYRDAADLATKAAMTVHAFESENPAAWRALASHGVFRGQGPAPKVAFLFTGQGSQYLNMLCELRGEAAVADTFAEADRIMAPILGAPLSDLVFCDADAHAADAAARRLDETAVTQPAVLAADVALARLLNAYGVLPDMVMGHSLGEYAALVAAGALDFADALLAVSSRGRAVAALDVPDAGRMAAVLAPLAVIERAVAEGGDGVSIVNFNSTAQAVIAGTSEAVDRTQQALQKDGFSVIPLHVSHAFHTSIVAPAGAVLRDVLGHLDMRPPVLPVVANVTGDFYPTGPDVVPQIIDSLARHLSSPIQFAKGLRTLYEAGARVFIEAGPKHALHGFALDVLGEHPDVVALFTNHPKPGGLVSFNHA
ncbi:MAG TPA: acyltransferase domain-containing protein, partial [Candidatus Dormibacteraeota bacterium]|nr:acyltransferase domain-containing protein [Candidatus Dormibacteraeota bacterium]